VGKLPLEPIRQILKEESNINQISVDAVVELRDFLEYITIRLSEEASREMVKFNKSREWHGLKKKRRLPRWIIKEATNNVLKKIANKETGSRFAEIRNPGGKNMSLQTQAAKSAKKETDNAGGDTGEP
jgi:hypothetical protein